MMLKSLDDVINAALNIPNWWLRQDAEELCRLSYFMPTDSIAVEVGSFLGAGTVLLAGPRKLRASGKVFCVDPFDCSGDAFSVPYYLAILRHLGGGNLRDYFEANVTQLELSDHVQICQGLAADVAASWTAPVDLLLLDGDQSPEGAKRAYQAWVGFLRPGGIIAVHNSAPREYAEGHNGYRLVVLEQVTIDQFEDIRLVGETTFARRRPFLDSV
jgi:predicted O-methyltransferase YrrM